METFYIYWKHLTDEAKEEYLDYFGMDSSDINNPPNFIDTIQLAGLKRVGDLDEE